MYFNQNDHRSLDVVRGQRGKSGSSKEKEKKYNIIGVEGKLEQEDLVGKGMGRQIKEEISGGSTNTTGHLKSYKETYYSRSFLYCIHINGVGGFFCSCVALIG